MVESKYASLSGVAFAVLLVAAFLVDPNTAFMPSEAEVVEYLQESPLRILTGAYLGLLAAGALVWFTASAHRSLRRGDDDDGRLAVLAAGGGVFAAALLAVGEVASIAAAERVWMHDAIDPGAAAALFDFSGIAIGNGTTIGLAVLIGASAITGLRTPGSARWVSWVGVLVAVTLASPYGWAALVVAIVWIPAAGIAMYRAERSADPIPVA